MKRLSPKPMPSLFTYHEDEDFFDNDYQVVKVLNTKQMREQLKIAKTERRLNTIEGMQK